MLLPQGITWHQKKFFKHDSCACPEATLYQKKGPAEMNEWGLLDVTTKLSPFSGAKRNSDERKSVALDGTSCKNYRHACLPFCDQRRNRCSKKEKKHTNNFPLLVEWNFPHFSLLEGTQAIVATKMSSEDNLCKFDHDNWESHFLNLSRLQ